MNQPLLETYKYEFITFALDNQVLQFGEFTLKSGRTSPYFFNFGLFKSGAAISRLGSYYAKAIAASDLSFDMLFGPAYKGIPLVTIVAAKLFEEQGKDYPYAYNRKEAKDHGEGGNIVGAEISGKVLIVDDVISAGTACREAADIITQQSGKLAGMAISLDRGERGKGEQSAVQEVEQALSLQVINIVDLNDVIDYLQSYETEHSQYLPAIEAYREQYGV